MATLVLSLALLEQPKIPSRPEVLAALELLSLAAPLQLLHQDQPQDHPHHPQPPKPKLKLKLKLKIKLENAQKIHSLMDINVFARSDLDILMALVLFFASLSQLLIFLTPHQDQAQAQLDHPPQENQPLPPLSQPQLPLQLLALAQPQPPPKLLLLLQLQFKLYRLKLQSLQALLQ